MKSECPYQRATAEPVMSNYDHRIDEKVAAELKAREVFARYPGWDFNGRVWWDRERSIWRCEVWVFGEPDSTIEHTELEAIMAAVCEQYGAD